MMPYYELVMLNHIKRMEYLQALLCTYQWTLLHVIQYLSILQFACRAWQDDTMLYSSISFTSSQTVFYCEVKLMLTFSSNLNWLGNLIHIFNSRQLCTAKEPISVYHFLSDAGSLASFIEFDTKRNLLQASNLLSVVSNCNYWNASVKTSITNS